MCCFYLENNGEKELDIKKYHELRLLKNKKPLMKSNGHNLQRGCHSNLTKLNETF